MNTEQLFRALTFICIGVLLYFMVLKPMISRVKTDWKLKKRIRLLRKLGFNIETPIRDPHLSDDEINLLKSDEEPTEEHILKYYKMYCKKWELDNQDKWTTLKPMDFEKWEKKAKTPTKIHEFNNKNSHIAGFQISGGYQFIIPSTCDTMIGFPPMNYYHRYHDYAAMVETDDDELMETLENAETT